MRDPLSSFPGSARSIARKATAAPKAPAIFRAGTLSSAPPGPTVGIAGSGGKSPTNRNALPPPASPPSSSYHPGGATRSTGPSPPAEGRSTRPSSRRENPSEGIKPGGHCREEEKTGTPPDRTEHSTASPVSRTIAVTLPAPLPRSAKDRAADSAHPDGIAPVRRRPARDTASSHHPLYSAGAAVTPSVPSFPPAAPGRRRQPNRSREGGKGNRRSSSSSRAGRRSFSRTRGKETRAE